MCGIAGALASGDLDPAVLPRMGDAIEHRGPDGEGYLLYGPERGIEVLMEERPGAAAGRGVSAGLAHRRLSIIDLTDRSGQPFVDAGGELAIAYNGELYNYLELREELEQLGHEFASDGDTEVVLSAYREWGTEALHRFVGMWAFAIVDGPRRRMFFAVDRFGIKPLHTALSNGTLFFGSEIKALLAAGVDPSPNESVVRKFLYTGRVDERDETFFEGIDRLPPGHFAVASLEGPAEALRPQRYWHIADGERFRGSRRGAAEEFASRFAESVRVHLRSDVPVGTCLSGGLDSSAIVCVADELRRSGAVPNYAHHGFGYLPDDPSVSERSFMENVVARTGIDMTYVSVDPRRFREALLGVVRQQDEPFGTTSIVAQHFVFGAAAERRFKVMLDGQGADEVLGGYHGYFPAIGVAHLRSHHPLKYLRFNRAHRRLTGESVVPREHLKLHWAPERYMAGAVPQLSEGPATAVMTEGLRSRFEPSEFVSPEHRSINELLADHTAVLGLPSLLRFEDRNSMAHSIEARVPFLDHRLVEFAFSLPGNFKIDGVRTKAVLRDAMRGTLPEEVRGRTDKVGFRAEPTATWDLAGEHREALTSNRTPWEEEWFRPDSVDTLLAGRDRDYADEAVLWRVLNTKLWLRAFWDPDREPLEA